MNTDLTDVFCPRPSVSSAVKLFRFPCFASFVIFCSILLLYSPLRHSDLALPGPLAFEQKPFPGEPSGEAAERPVFRQDPVAGTKKG